MLICSLSAVSLKHSAAAMLKTQLRATRIFHIFSLLSFGTVFSLANGRLLIYASLGQPVFPSHVLSKLVSGDLVVLVVFQFGEGESQRQVLEMTLLSN